jgi:hypothetical protein
MKWTNLVAGGSSPLLPFYQGPFVRLDPHLIWAGLTYLHDPSDRDMLIPVMFEAKKDAHGHVQIPPTVSLIEGTRRYFSPFFTGFVKYHELPHFAPEVERFRIAIAAVPPDLYPHQPQPLGQEVQYSVDDVVIGIIDHGIAFANKQFAVKDGQGHWRSRIERIWEQRWGYPRPPEGQPWNVRDPHLAQLYDANSWEAVEGYGYGRHLTNEPASRHIDFWLNEPLSEAEIYRQLGYLPVQHDRAHGTHVLAVAAGAQSHSFDCRGSQPVETMQDPASSAKIIAVQLPAFPYKDTSGMGLCVQILDAISYIRFHAGARKCVINLSDGAYAGPHNGKSLLERALDNFLGNPRTRPAFVVAAGNQFDARVHWKCEVPPGGSTELTWRILPDDNSDSHLEIWPAEGSPAADLQVSVASPGVAASPFVKVGHSLALYEDAGARPLAAILFSGDPPNAAPVDSAHPRAMVHVAVAATRPRRGTPDATAPHGVWTVRLKNTGRTPIEIDAYIERDNPALGDSGPRRQSYFVHPDYPRSATKMLPALDDSDNPSPIKRMGALNNVATAKSALVVGGYVYQTGQLGSYSAAGPGRAIRANVRGNAGVDVLAVSDCSQTIRGVRAAAVRTGTTFRMDGTSVSAPQITRWIAKWMHENSPPTGGWAQVIAPYASNTNPTLLGPVERTGYGRL